MSEKPRKKCPSCGKLKLERQIGLGGGVIFKGSGFYETDYRSESYKKGESSAKPAPAPKKSADSAGTSPSE
jgi:predicted nucleic acid-binding Zn ribbon protein